ncbi:aspartate aminotransferase-like [Watersipora subatra]|uniref:aspartate aminotransferase-like n=1 Tax=Watersipora subatra TaxID=2589382 RepID=UPI00355BC84A
MSEKNEKVDDGSHYRRKDLHKYGQASNLKMNEHVKKLQSQGQQIHHLAFGQSPFPVPEKLCSAMQKHAFRNDYVSMSGIADLRSAICQHHNSFPTGYPEALIQPENIVVADGSKILIYLTMVVTDTVVILKAPSWTTYQSQVTLAGRQQIIVNCPFEDEWKITPQNLIQTLEGQEIQEKNLLLIFNNPGNPSGLLYTTEELEALGKVFRRYRILVISDEIYANLTYPDSCYTSLAKFYPEGTVVTTGLSKWSSAGGWRVGYAIFPPQLSNIREAVISAASHTYSCCAAPQQYAATEFLRDIESCKDFMYHTRRILHAVSIMCVKKLRAVGVRVHKSHAGYYIHPDFSNFREDLGRRSIFTGQQMCDAILAETKVALLPGAILHLEEPNSLTTRLCYVNFDGIKALEVSREIGLDQKLGEDFVDCYCQPTVEAIESLAAWCTNLKN